MENEVKKSKKGLVIAIIAILVIAIIAGLAYYFLRSTSPKDVFISKINTVMKEGNNVYNAQNEKINSTITLSGNIETTNNEIKQIAQYINDGKINLNLQADIKNKKISVSTDIDYKTDKIISGKVFYQDGDKNLYLYIQDLFDKYFKIDMKDALKDGDIEGILANAKLASGEEANQIFVDTIKENLKEEYFSKEKVDDMTKNTMKIKIADLKNIYTNVVTSLKNNEKYLNCFDNKEKIKANLEKALESIKDIEEEYDNCDLEISLYTKGISKELQKVDAKVIVSEKEEGTFSINKVNDNNFEFKLNVKTEEKNMPVNVEALTGTINREKINDNAEKYTIVIDNIPDFGKVTLNIELKMQNETDLDNINVSDSVEIEKMTQADMVKLYTNLTKMKIYPLIAPFLGAE